jgi:putative transposase
MRGVSYWFIRDAKHRVSTNTGKIASIHKPVNQFGPQAKNLSSIIRGYKSAITTYSRKNDSAFTWQERFHDHIIRSEKEYHEIANYIMNNPVNWQKDKFFR